MPQKKAHGSKTIATLLPEERERLYATLNKHTSDDNMKLAKNMATKYGVSWEEVLGVLSRFRRGLSANAGELPRKK